jgi:hypothetical protein
MIKKMSAGIPVLLASVCLFANEYSNAQAKEKANSPKEQRAAGTAAFERGGFPGGPGQVNRRGQFGRGGMNGRFGRGGMGGRGMQFNMLQRYLAEKQIAGKFPAEYAAADKEFLTAVAKLESLAARAKVTLPLSLEIQLRKLRAKSPGEFAKLEELSQTDPRSVFSKIRELSEKHQIPLWESRDRRQGNSVRPPAPAPAARKNPQQIMRVLRKVYPEEMKKIMALREENPRLFAQKLQELNNRYNKEKAEQKK